MAESIERRCGEGSNDRQYEGWRVVVSAWALVLFVVVLLAGASAVACLRGGSQPHRPLTGAIIPQHDPCVGPGVPSAPAIDGCQAPPLTGGGSAYW